MPLYTVVQAAVRSSYTIGTKNYSVELFAEQEELEQFEAVETIRQRDLSLEFESLFTVDVHSVVE